MTEATGSEPVRVLVVDDQELFRRGLIMLLAGDIGATMAAGNCPERKASSAGTTKASDLGCRSAVISAGICTAIFPSRARWGRGLSSHLRFRVRWPCLRPLPLLCPGKSDSPSPFPDMGGATGAEGLIGAGHYPISWSCGMPDREFIDERGVQ